MLTEKEMKVLRLALDPAASQGESDNGAILLFRMLRARLFTADQLLQTPTNSSTNEVIYSRPDYGLCTMPWGKHRGEMFVDIPPTYLAWALEWINEDPERAQKMRTLAESIEGFLAQ